ncbi:MAG: AbiH family protein [Fusobacterium sp. JB019]|nr:AbiH family protein [Fusobacterium sp. JB019]
MSKLFIIGNGFDLSHCMDTRYSDFRKYLIRTYPESEKISEEDDIFFDKQIDGHGEIVKPLDYQVVGWLLNTIDFLGDYNWSDLENYLGMITFDNYYNEENYPEDEDGDINPWKQVEINEDIYFYFPYMGERLFEFFNDWVYEIKYKKSLKDFSRLINLEKDYFLNFNYTETLEKKYNIKKVCHIHGKLGETLLFGHGNDEECISEVQGGLGIGAEDSVQSTRDIWKKDTKGALENNKNFFDQLGNKQIKKIYSYGFSYGKVDEIYIKEIIKKINGKDVTWYLDDYNNEINLNYKKIIEDLGFKGKIKEFSCN